MKLGSARWQGAVLATLGALAASGCEPPEAMSGPGPETEGEASALSDAAEMLEMRDPPADQASSAADTEPAAAERP